MSRHRDSTRADLGERSRVVRMTRKEVRAAALFVSDDEYERPRTRGDCVDQPRPCPFVGCRHHLYLDVNPETGTIKFNRPSLEVWDLAESCSLDVSDRVGGPEGAGLTLDEVGVITNLTHERVRQVEVRALLGLKAAGALDKIVGDS